MYLDSDRVALRDFCAEDISVYAKYHADARYLRFYSPEVGDFEHARKLVDSFIRSAQEKPHRNFTFAIVDRDTSQLIGCCSLRTAGQPDGCAEFGLELSPDRWGRGLAAEAARALLEFGFSALVLSKVRAESVTQNHRVGRLVRKLGFVRMAARQGTPWMTEQGWTYTDWLLTKSAWAASGCS